MLGAMRSKRHMYILDVVEDDDGLAVGGLNSTARNVQDLFVATRAHGTYERMASVGCVALVPAGATPGSRRYIHI
jgi:hypothetical protein